MKKSSNFSYVIMMNRQTKQFGVQRQTGKNTTKDKIITGQKLRQTYVKRTSNVRQKVRQTGKTYLRFKTQ